MVDVLARLARSVQQADWVVRVNDWRKTYQTLNQGERGGPAQFCLDACVSIEGRDADKILSNGMCIV